MFSLLEPAEQRVPQVRQVHGQIRVAGHDRVCRPLPGIDRRVQIRNIPGPLEPGEQRESQVRQVHG
jgi:hypothetical protein